MFMKVIAIAICFLIGAIGLTFSVLQFMEKGPLLNDIYFYAPKNTVRRWIKRPYYRQSAIILLLSGLNFIVVGLNLIFNKGWLMIANRAILTALVIYALASTAWLWRVKK